MMGPVNDLSIRTDRKIISGWVGVGLFAFLYMALYAGNFLLPLNSGTYTTRIWGWSQAAFTLVALIALIQKRHLLTPGTSLLGFSIAAISTFSHVFNSPSVWDSLLKGIAIWICFLAGVVLFKELEGPGIPAFQSPLTRIVRSLLFGVVAAIPLAAINNLYFYVNSGSISFQNVLKSAFDALSPGISEEIVYRFFILAVCFSLLKSSEHPRLVMAVAIILAVVPHSLDHLPDLFLDNPLMGLGMLAATSLLFGLPMALLQIKKNLETAIAFHWFIDFARFLFGF